LTAPAAARRAAASGSRDRAAFLLVAFAGLIAPGAGAAAPPANDAFAAALAIAGDRGSVEGANAGATKEPGEPAHAGNAGGASVWFRWTAPRDGQFAVATGQSDFDTLLAVYTGPGLGALAPVAADDDSGPGPTSEVSFRAAGGTVYHVAVDGFLGKVGRVALDWRPAPANDNFADAQTVEGEGGTTKSPGTGATKEAGEPSHAGEGEADRSVWFRWTAPATLRVGFVVRGDADRVAAYTGTTLDTLTRVGSQGGRWPVFDATAGATYHLAVEGAGRETVLLWQPGPPNDDFAEAAAIAGASGRVRGSTVAATRQAGEPRHGPGSRASVWYRWRAPRNGLLSLVTAGSTYDTLLAVYRGSSLATLRRLAADDDAGPALASAVRIPVRRGRVYRAAVDGFGGETGEVVLRWALRPRPR
jgi:hypothetical protein